MDVIEAVGTLDAMSPRCGSVESRLLRGVGVEGGTLMKRLFAFALSLGLVAALAVPAAAEVNTVTPSTNDINITNNWAHYDVLNTGFGEVTVEFVQPRNFYACFEWRIDGDTSPADGTTNYNTDITDGLYPFKCLSTIDASEKTLYADQYVEIRMVFGAERKERFDWTRLDVSTKSSCKDGGWEDLGYKNQGACVSAVVSNREK